MSDGPTDTDRTTAPTDAGSSATGRTDEYTGFGSKRDATGAVPSQVPADEEPDVRCPHCDRPFRDADLVALHVGEQHPDECSAADREAYDDVYDAESDALFIYHMKVIAAIVVLFFGFTYLYAFVLS